ncbi:MAG TPA: hypothetical protein VEL76_02010, partial [Gemmataceae bacterium]|nr:hypothetical protein [Gemmataceae bacterium]
NGPGGAAGTRVVCRNTRSRDSIPENNGVMFEGEDNKWIFVSRGRILAGRGGEQDMRLINEPLPAGAVRLGTATNHMANFLDCVRSRQQPVCNPVVGHRSCSVCHLGNIAIRTGRRLTWNPSEERFTGEHAADGNRMLAREMRGEWAEFWRRQTANP